MRLMNVLAVALILGFPAVGSAQTTDCQKTDCQDSSQSQCTAEVAVKASQDCNAECTDGKSCCQDGKSIAVVVDSGTC